MTLRVVELIVKPYKECPTCYGTGLKIVPQPKGIGIDVVVCDCVKITRRARSRNQYSEGAKKHA